MIRIEGFHKAYGDTIAVSDLSLALDPGQILGLVGPNGAGKTTTLRVLAGIIPPTQGRLSVAGHDIRSDPVAAKRELAYVPDDPSLFDTLTVWEHLQFTASAYRTDNLDEDGMRLLDLFELTEKKNTMAHELSRGMRQKTAICCAYLHNPAVLLLDEPHTGLDPRGIRSMKDSILERAEAGATVVVSSHMLAMVEDLCTHLSILHRGQLLFTGSMRDARERFADLSGDVSLEDVFFRATEGNAPPHDPGPGSN